MISLAININIRSYCSESAHAASPVVELPVVKFYDALRVLHYYFLEFHLQLVDDPPLLLGILDLQFHLENLGVEISTEVLDYFSFLSNLFAPEFAHLEYLVFDEFEVERELIEFPEVFFLCSLEFLPLVEIHLL